MTSLLFVHSTRDERGRIYSLAEAVTFLGNQERDRNLYAIPGLDYVAHEDVIPYTVRLLIRCSPGASAFVFQSTERTPIEHELFDKFLMHDSEASECQFYCLSARSLPRLASVLFSPSAPNFVPREHLKSWQERHHLWLELSDVSKDVTHQVRVTVIPFYM